MKVTICSEDEPGRIGGPWAWLPRFVKGLEDRGIEVSLIFFHALKAADCEHLQYFIKKGNKVSYKSWHSLTQWHDNTEDRVRWVLREIEKDPPDIFIPNLVLPALFAARWIRETGIPTIGILHSDDPFFYKVAGVFWGGPKSFRLSSVVCVSEDIKMKLNQTYPGRAGVFTIPCMTPVPDEKASWTGSDLQIVYTGRIVEEQKRISIVAGAFSNIVSKIRGVQCYIYGSGPDEQKVLDIINQNGVSERVHYMGAVNSADMQDRLLDHQIFTIISDYEGMPVSLLEAMASGLVPVCKRIDSGLPEVIIDGETGYLFDDWKTEYPEIIRMLADDRKLWERLSKNARELIIDKYSDKALIAKWKEVFAYLLKDIKKSEEISFPKNINIPKELIDV